jgi:hypothetical protein
MPVVEGLSKLGCKFLLSLYYKYPDIRKIKQKRETSKAMYSYFKLWTNLCSTNHDTSELYEDLYELQMRWASFHKGMERPQIT